MRRSCPLCGAHEGGPVWKGVEAEAIRCVSCGLAYLSWIDETAERLARKTYDEIYTGPAWLDPLTRISYERLLDDFERRRVTGSILDIGCGAGGFLAVAAERGWDACGTEIAEGAGGLARQAGAQVLIGERATEAFEARRFDVVTLFEVVEHVSSPMEVLREAHRVLRPGGLLYLTTPNAAGLQRRMLGPRWPMYHVEHLTYFDAVTLRAALTRSGLGQSVVLSKNFDPFRCLQALLVPRSRLAADPDASAATVVRPIPSWPARGRQALRRVLKGNPVGRSIMSGLNHLLAGYDLGDTLVAIAEAGEDAHCL